MDTYVDARLERVERALVTLSESIAKYMPQPAQSIELSNADRDLSAALHTLQTHQNNYLTLSALKAQSDALDAQIRDTLRLLWTTRRDISTTHVTTFPDAATRFDVNWEELLGYARRISKTTLPAPSILAAASATTTNGGDSAQSTGEAVNTPVTTAAQTPAPGGATPSNANGGTSTPAAQPPAPPPPGPMDLPPEWNQFLDPLTGVTFVPWPLELSIRSGALASIEDLARQGIDPRGYDPLEEEARRRREEEERRVREEIEAREREEKVRLAREEQMRIARERQRERERAQEEAARRGSMVGGEGYSGGAISPTVQQPGGKKQFQFMGDDDDDDDD
ncbi:hypothetical protein N0V93_007618 [Gnomoniopsis smithogilvyi]|uniref:Mediator of RNA polymerase II transcription subunit 4 n=1 Tax=Gnomoniopsis smithogilvyi TaxID=1191159 RepID=A0A9W8YS58_9PEZI|nr:hypothetical protein N0V93_007618 [Gnomoniopsis smithogilvyi]